MTVSRVDFYVLEGADHSGIQLFTCRLCEKAFSQKNRVYIHTRNQHESSYLDKLLWTFKAGSFLPHAMTTDQTEESMLIGHQEQPPKVKDVLINLNPQIPSFSAQFERIIELVGSENRAQARLHFQYYQQCSYQIHTHKLQY